MCAWFPVLYCLLDWPLGPWSLNLNFWSTSWPRLTVTLSFQISGLHYTHSNPVVVFISPFCFAFPFWEYPEFILSFQTNTLVTEGNFEWNYLRWFISWRAWRRLLISQSVRDSFLLKQRYTKKPQCVVFLLRSTTLRARAHLHIYNFIICVIPQLYFQWL